jgi:hydrogenase large subunit
MSKRITIDPVTRISGFLEINAEVESDVVVNARTSGLLYRGFEKMLKGRPPLDAIYFTERICGICSTAHSICSTLALENALKVTVDLNDSYIRDLTHGFEFIQNHLRQFYLFTVPGFVKMPDISPLSPQEYTDFRIPRNLNEKLVKDYAASVDYSRLAHEGLATLGGKAPHNHGIFVGGVTVNINSYNLSQVKSIIIQIKDFINNSMMEDMEIISRYYPDYFEKGASYPNFMSYGLFDRYNDPDITYVKPGVIVKGKSYPFDPNKITENIQNAWYTSGMPTEKPGIEDLEEVNISKPGAYTFVKAPRYEGLPMEVGPLARLILTGEYTSGNSCMDRNIARVLETKKIIGIMEKLTERIELKPNNQRPYEIPDRALGVGLVDTTRGSLGHWVQIEDKVIKYYDIITPSSWNLSPIDSKGLYGVGERALIGSKINNVEEPVELGRIIRSFDPCVSCATHLLRKDNESIKIKVL